jgi:nucleoside-diphosphate-sugar epimerase
MRVKTSFWAGRRVCVTGGAGFLGWHLVQTLRRLRAKVRVLALEPRASHPIHGAGDVARFWGDVRDQGVVRRALRGCSVVFHTAGVVGVWGEVLQQMWSVHVQGMQQVLDCLEPDARLVHTSSITTLGAFTRPR